MQRDHLPAILVVITLHFLRAFEGWKDAKCSRMEKSFCWDNFISPITMQMMEDMRNQFLDLLSDIGFVDKSGGAKAYNQYGDDMEMVCAVLCAGLYPNVVQCKRRGKRTALYTKEVGKVDIHAGGNLIASNSGDGIEMLGGYFHFSASETVLDLIRKLRGELDKLLRRKIEELGFDVVVEGKGVVAAVVELLHSRNVRYK